MPIYEFKCAECNQVFELLAMNKNDRLEAKCPHCGGEDLSRVISTCSSVINGSPSTHQASKPGMESHSCANAGNCATITLPGYER